MDCCQHPPAAARWCLDADDLLSLDSWPRQRLCPPVLSPKSPQTHTIPAGPLSKLNRFSLIPNLSSLGWIQNGHPLIYGRGLASFHRCTAHAQLAACLPLLHHSHLQHSQYNFLYTCFISLSRQSNDVHYCGRKCLSLIGCHPLVLFTCRCSLNTKQPLLHLMLYQTCLCMQIYAV